MMPDSSPFASLRRAGLLAAIVFVSACQTTPPAGSSRQTAPPRSLAEALGAAESALSAGDCRASSESYLAAARFAAEPEVAMRAVGRALSCQNLTAAQAAAARWRELAPYSGEAALAAAMVAMKRYDLVQAREALTAWRDSGAAGGQDPLSFVQTLAGEVDASIFYRLFGEVLVGEDPTAQVLLAQARLAQSAQNMQVAMQAAERAVALNAGMLEAEVIAVRALSVLGEDARALSAARQLQRSGASGESDFLLADVLLAAGRAADAETELTRLAGQPDTVLGAAGRLVAQSFQQGRLDAAERWLGFLVSVGGPTPMAALYLAELAERRGDVESALQGYGLLADTPLELAGRSAAAQLLFERGEKEGALALLDAYAAEDPAQALEAGLTRAQGQADAGDLRGALAVLDTLARHYPDHPDIDYTRATVLETGGRTRNAVAEFERALQLRPEDPQLLNALGYTLADHKQRLVEAEALVRRALAVSPDSPAIQDSLGWVLYRAGRLDEARPVLERAWRNSGDAEIGAHFGEVLWQSGDEGQARYVWQQALNGNPGHDGLTSTMARLTGEDVE